jgi:hypothetical protein
LCRNSNFNAILAHILFIMATALENDIGDQGAKYINPPKNLGGTAAKRQGIDHSKLRQGWVRGCSAALSRRDTTSSSSSVNSGNASGKIRGRGRGGYRPYWVKRGPGSSRGGFKGRGWRGK